MSCRGVLFLTRSSCRSNTVPTLVSEFIESQINGIVVMTQKRYLKSHQDLSLLLPFTVLRVNVKETDDFGIDHYEQ